MDEVGIKQRTAKFVEYVLSLERERNDLLAALQKIIDISVQQQKLTHGDPALAETLSVVVTARAAIAKATARTDGRQGGRMSGDREKEGGSAFPNFVPEGHYNGSVHFEGMSLRDYFAARAMQSALVSESAMQSLSKATTCNNVNLIDLTAISAYVMADAMIRARAK